MLNNMNNSNHNCDQIGRRGGTEQERRRSASQLQICSDCQRTGYPAHGEQKFEEKSISRCWFSSDGFQVGGQAGRSYKLEGLEKRDTGGWKIRFGQHFRSYYDLFPKWIPDILHSWNVLLSQTRVEPRRHRGKGGTGMGPCQGGVGRAAGGELKTNIRWRKCTEKMKYFLRWALRAVICWGLLVWEKLTCSRVLTGKLKSLKLPNFIMTLITPQTNYRLSVGDEVIPTVGEVVVGVRVCPAAALVLNRVVFLQVWTYPTYIGKCLREIKKKMTCIRIAKMSALFHFHWVRGLHLAYLYHVLPEDIT